MKKIVYVFAGLLLLLLIVINVSLFHKTIRLKKMRADYSFIIDKGVNFNFLDSTHQQITSDRNYVLCIVSPTCEDCYVKINRWNALVEKHEYLRGCLYFLVTGDEFERLDELVKEKTYLRFIFDYDNVFLKLNPYCLPSQTYLISKDNKVILCGTPLSDKTMMNLFLDNLK